MGNFQISIVAMSGRFRIQAGSRLLVFIASASASAEKRELANWTLPKYTGRPDDRLPE